MRSFACFAMALIATVALSAFPGNAAPTVLHAKVKQQASQGNEPLYYLTLNGYPTQYGPKSMAFWALFLHDMYLGIAQGSSPGPVTVLFVNSNDYTAPQYWALQHAIARRTPGNPLCTKPEFCGSRLRSDLNVTARSAILRALHE